MMVYMAKLLLPGTSAGRSTQVRLETLWHYGETENVDYRVRPSSTCHDQV